MAINTKILLDNSKVIQPNNCTLTLCGNTRINSTGTLQYCTDQSGSYIGLSVPDVAFVTGCTSAIETNIANNYYNKTEIDYYTGTTVPNAYYNKTEINSYTAATDTRIDNIETITDIAVTGATNGLTKVGREIKLGGTLTGSTIITDGRGTPVGIQYGGDYSANYTARSIPDVDYVTGLTSLGIQTANNGLTKVGTNVVLGGTLTGDTTINTNNKTLVVGKNNSVGAQGSNSVILGASNSTMNCGNAAIIGGYNNQVDGGFAVTVGGYYNCALGLGTLATGGEYNKAHSSDSAVVNGRCNETCGIASGVFVGFRNVVCAGCSAIIGGENNIIHASDSCSVIIGGDGIVTTGSLPNHAIVPSLAIFDTPNAGSTTTDEILVWNSTDKKVKRVNGGAVLTSAITGATNGLTKTGQNVKLGGELVETTTIFGSQEFDVNVNTVKITGATGAVSIGGSGLYVTATVPGTGGLLCVGAGGEVCQTSLAAFGGITGATNGLTDCGNQQVGFGGSLCADTSICGAGFDLSMGTSGSKLDLFNIHSSGNIGVTSDNNLEVSVSGGTITTSDLQGLRYTTDYSDTFVNNSLVSKLYVDTVASGLDPKSAVLVATTGSNLDLSGGETIDGVALTGDERVLVKDQTDKTENGIYVVNGSGAWTRATDFDGTPVGEVTQGALIPILSGSTNINSSWILVTPDPITLDTTELTFSKFSQLLDIGEGNGINISTVGETKTISVELASNSGLEFNGTGLTVDDTIAGNGLTWSTGVINVNAPSGGTLGVAVKRDGSDNLVVNTADINTALGGVLSGSTNGLTDSNGVVCLGGQLTTATTICGSDTNTFTYQDTAITNKRGILYADDYSSTFINNSLVSKKYVDAQVSGGTASLLADNGLTRVGDTFILGGELTGETTITVADYGNLVIQAQNSSNAYFVVYGGDSGDSEIIAKANSSCVHVLDNSVKLCGGGSSLVIDGDSLIITDGTGDDYGIQYAADYSSTFVARSLVDAAYVTGITSTIESQVAQGITGATNGLTKTGYDVKLGGTQLTEETIIAGNSQIFSLTGLTEVNFGATTVDITGTVLLSTEPSAGSTSDSVLVRASDGTVKTVAGSSLGEDNNVYSYTAITSNVTLTTGSSYVIFVNPSAEFTVTLPATPINGQVFKIKDISGQALTYNVIIDGNGNNIDGGSSASINTDYGALELIYNGSDWFSLAFIN